MKTIYTFIALLLITTVSCNSTPKMTALEYNDAIINEQSKIVEVILKFNSNDGTDMQAFEDVRKEIVTQCDSSIMKITALSDFDGSTEFRDAGIELFRFYKDISSNEYRQMLEILEKGDFTEEDLEDLTTIQKAIETKEAPKDARFQSAQQAFAKDNNITIGNNALQDQIDAMGE